jgi:hypothetical protein
VSDLQLALTVLALAALLALYLGEKWQDHRRLRRLRERLHGGVGDALLEARAQAPIGPAGFGGALAPAEAAAAYAGEARAAELPRRSAARIEPFVAAPERPSGPGDVEPPAPPDESADGADRVISEPLATPAILLRPDWAEDPLLDCSLEVRMARAVDGVSVIDAAAPLGHENWKLPVHFVVWDGRHQQWVLPDRFGYYSDALVSIQLANRRACLDAAELERFVRMVQELAQRLGADVDLPDSGRLIAQAQDLDRLCGRFDVRLGLTVECPGAPWTGPQLRNAAQECGFVAAGGQRWVRRMEAGAGGEIDLFTLQIAPGQLTRLGLELDLALAPPGAHAFAAMVQSARELADALDGRVVDDNGQPIEARSVQAIEQQLERAYQEMRAAGIEPGSTRARRLYG